MKNAQMNTKTSKAIDRVFRGAMIQAYAGAEAADEIRATTIAYNARTARASSRRQFIQTGGVLNASEARHIVHTRAEKEAERLLKVQQRKKAREAKIAAEQPQPLIQPDFEAGCFNTF
jgi:hypothetical protein